MARKKVEVPTREELSALVDELNSILGLDPAIKVSKKMTDEELIEKIKEIATDNVYESDCKALSDDDVEGEHFYSEDAVKVFGMLGIEIAAGSPPEQSTESPAEVKEEVEEKAPAKGKKEKAAPAEKPAKEKKEKAAPVKEKKEKKERKYTRANAIVDAIEAGDGTKEEIIKKSNELFMKNNPDAEDSPMSAKGMFNCVIPTLVAAGYITYDKGIIKLVQ